MKSVFLYLSTLVALAFMSSSVEAKRNLLSSRKSRGVRGYSWTDEQNWSISKFFKHAEKTVSKDFSSVVDDMENEIESLGEEAEDFISNAATTIENALDGAFVERTSDLFDDISSDFSNGWQDLIAGFDSIEDYFENQFENDLQWIAGELVTLWNFVCDDSAAEDVATAACSASLSALACVATDGLGPFCGVGTLLENIVPSAVSDLIDTVVTCTVYYSIQNLPIDGWCDGMAYSVAELITDVFEADPFTPICDAAVSCSCGTCPYTCAYPVSSSCNLSTYENAVSELISELSALLS